MRIVGQSGVSVEEETKALLEQIKKGLVSDAKKQIPIVLVNTVRGHFKRRFPGSRHWSPDKVTNGGSSSTEKYVTGVANVDVAGATRAYHDVQIRPRVKNYLTIPLHKDAYGKKASDFSDTFVERKKDGKLFIAKKSNGMDNTIKFLYVLIGKEGVHQKQDGSLMPSDETLAKNIMNSI